MNNTASLRTTTKRSLATLGHTVGVTVVHRADSDSLYHVMRILATGALVPFDELDEGVGSRRFAAQIAQESAARHDGWVYMPMPYAHRAQEALVDALLRDLGERWRMHQARIDRETKAREKDYWTARRMTEAREIMARHAARMTALQA